MANELTKALLLEEVVAPDAIAKALFVSLGSPVPLIRALIDAGAAPPSVIARYLDRADAPALRQVAPVLDLVERLPPGLCAKLLAVPVRRDAITGTVDVAVADATDPHPAKEIGFHLDAPIRLVRAPLSAIEEALQHLPNRSLPPGPPAGDEDRLYDSRPRARAPALTPATAVHRGTLPPPEPVFDGPSRRSSRAPKSVPQAGLPRVTRDTPPWGTPVHNTNANAGSSSIPPRSGFGSEIPIPLTRRAYGPVPGGTQRPPPLVNPRDTGLGEGYAVPPGLVRAVVEVRSDQPARHTLPQEYRVTPSFFPGAPPVPTVTEVAYVPELPYADMSSLCAALRATTTRDEVLELILAGGRMVAVKVALFVVKRAGYMGWACSPELADRSAIQSVLVPLGASRAFDEAVREGLYLGPLRQEHAHVGILHVMRRATPDVAIVPIRVGGKTVAVVLADELGDTMIGTRRLEELARAAGEAFTRLVRTRRET